MHLCFMRHGIAEKVGALYTMDQIRPLSAEGVEEIESVAAQLARMEAAFDLILTSPLLRARQTAEIIARECGYGKAPEKQEFLDGHSNVESMAGFLETLPRAATILLIGHSPSLDRLIAYLISSDDSAKVPLAPGTLAWVETETPTLRNGILHWLIPAKVWPK